MKPPTSGWNAVALIALACLALAAPVRAADRTAAPQIIPRSEWAANPADTTLMQPQTPREIVIHHTGEKQQPQQTLKNKLQKLQKFSQTAGSVEKVPKPAWGDVPYHFYIDSAGRIGEGRNINFAGDTNTSYDTANRIQLVVEGHFDKEQPSATQLEALDRLVLWLAARYKVPPAGISGHSDHVGNTDCPGQGLKAHLPVLRAKAAIAAKTSPPTR